MKRIYMDARDCTVNTGTIQIHGGTFHYLRKVLRMKKGDVFSGFDGRGLSYTINIDAVERDFLQGTILELKRNVDFETPFDLHLFQSVPKSGKMDSIIREVSQLGVKKIVPVISKRVIVNSPVERMRQKTDRWRKISAESSRISGRELVMEISEVMKFEDAVKIKSDLSIIFWESAVTPLRQIIQENTGLKKDAFIKIFVGPEGGYTEEEVSLAKDYGVAAASIGKRILKVETASVIASALTIYELENSL